MIYTTDIIGYQHGVFIKALELGLILGICYDFFRVIRTVFSFGKRLFFACDLIWSLWSGFLIFSFVLNENYGISRLYIFIAAGMGFLLWYFTAGKIIARLSKILKKLLGFIFRPIKKLFCGIYGILFEKYSKKGIRLLKKNAFMVYNILCLNVSKAFSFCGEKAGKEPESLESNGTEKTETESFPQGRSYRLRGISSCFSDIDPGEHQFKEK